MNCGLEGRRGCKNNILDMVNIMSRVIRTTRDTSR